MVDILAPMPDWYDPPQIGARPPGLSAADVAIALDAGRILALSHLALGANARARLVFLWMLRVDPAYMLTGSDISPNSMRVFFEVRAAVLGPRLAHSVAARALALPLTHARRRRAEALAEKIRARLEARRQDAQPLVFRFVPRIGGRWISLFGRDAEVYSDAPSLDLGLDLLVADTGWGFGVSVAWSVHDVRLEDLLIADQDQLEVLNVQFTCGYEWRYGFLGIRPFVGAGPTAFGLAEFFGAVGLSGQGGLTLAAHIGERLVVHVEAAGRPLLVFADASPFVSLTLVSGANIGLLF